MTNNDHVHMIGCAIVVGVALAMLIILFIVTDPVEIRTEYDIVSIDEHHFTYIDRGKMMCEVEYVNPLVQVFVSDRTHVVYVVSNTAMHPYYELYLNVSDLE